MGDWVSLRTCDTAFMRRTKLTYWASVGGTRSDPTLSFSPGPERPEDVSSYGTTYFDPNSHEITLLGGQPTSAGLLYPVNLANGAPSHFAGGRGTRKKETFHPSSSEPAGGHWTLDDKDFLGDTPQDDRTMHYALTLPTRQILIINGGNFDFYGPVSYPLLLTPKYDKRGEFTGYDRKRMAEAVEPRLYHNAALLMPDGRVWVSGGNTSRATVHSALPPQKLDSGTQTEQPKPNLDLVDIGRRVEQDHVHHPRRESVQHPAGVLHDVLRRLQGKAVGRADGAIRRYGEGALRSRRIGSRDKRGRSGLGHGTVGGRERSPSPDPLGALPPMRSRHADRTDP